MADPDFVKLRLETVEFRMSEYVRAKVEEFAKFTIVESIQDVAQSMGMSNRYLNSINIEVSGFDRQLVVKITVDYFGEKDEPLAFWFEHGTRDHGSKGDYAMHWVNKNGEDVYAWWVRGIKPHKIVKQGLDLGLPHFMALLRAELQDFATRTAV